MKILIVSIWDDNFGDMLIRISHESVLKVVLENLHIEYEIELMDLKNIDVNKIKNANLISFAGGGLFGLSYLNFYPSLNEILTIADENNIPVILSSMGVNNMSFDKNSDDYLKLQSVLNKKCIYSISVRENEEFFKKYLDNDSIKVNSVCDPAMWSKYVYYNDLVNIKKKYDYGINVVRGGLFKDNLKEWSVNDECEYLNNLIKLVEKNNYTYKLFTNGSSLDNNFLLYFVDKYNIDRKNVEIINTTRDLVKSIEECRKVFSIRMHSSIIACALEIPTCNIVWNDKIKYFYRNIGLEDYAITYSRWNSTTVFNKLDKTSKSTFKLNKKYLMTLYDYLFESISSLLDIKKYKKYSFDEIIEILKKDTVSSSNDVIDYTFKLNITQERYANLFKRNDNAWNQYGELKEKYKQLERNNDKNKLIITEQKDKIKKLNSMFSVRVNRKIRKFLLLPKNTIEKLRNKS